MIRYPDMRDYLVFSIRTLADTAYQQKVWIKRQLPKDKYEDGFGFAVHCIFDDLALNDEGGHHAVGAILYNEDELAKVQEVVAALDEVLKQVGAQSSDKQFVTSLYWPKVVLAARQAYSALTNGQDPGGLYEAIQRGESS